MPDENIFRFMSVRPAINHLDEQEGLTINLEEPASLDSKIRDAIAEGAPDDVVEEIIEEFRQSGRYIRSIRELNLTVLPLTGWLHKNKNTPVNDLNMPAVISDLYDKALPAFLNNATFKRAYTSLADSILIDSLSKEDVQRRDDGVMTAFKLMGFLKQIPEGEDSLPFETPLGRFINNAVIILPNLNGFTLLPDVNAEEPEEEQPDDDEANEEMRASLKELAQAHREIALLAKGNNLRVETEQIRTESSEDTPEGGTGESVRLSGTNLATVLQSAANLQGEDRRFLFNAIQIEDNTNLINTQVNKIFLDFEAVRRLSQSSQAVINGLNLPVRELDPMAATERIEQEMNFLSAQVATQVQPKRVLALGGFFLDKSRFKESLGFGKIFPGLLDIRKRCVMQAGVGDLLIVRQTLKAYELGEFAHVENVLAGESREREHRRLKLREEVTIEETESEVQKERDLQTTERNEIQAEAEKTVKDQFDLEAGLQVSGSYGPAVSFSSSLNASFSTSTEETQRKATSYSREVTERSAERVRERVREETRKRVLEEIEETNKHAVNNSDASNGHIRGIYRWLNKIYDAQVYNYGQRMMLEFVIPEPAAFFLYAMVENPPQDFEMEVPEPPLFEGKPLKPENLGRLNYQDYVSEFNVTNVPPPPSEFVVTSHFDKQDGNEKGNFGRSAKVTIPDGYEGYAAYVNSAYVRDKDKHAFYIMLGGVFVDHSGGGGVTFRNFPRRFRKEISVAVHLWRAKSFTLGVDIFCQLTSEGFTKWQQAVYDSIMEAYQQQLADYQEKLAALKIQQGIPILGRNPLENRRIEREELKKLVLMMLTGSTYIGFNSIVATPEPRINISQACKADSHIRFFEHSFEWHNMLYVFYPYFWGRHARWRSALQITDPDPDFAAFLKAGAARIQVPVQPGFERAVTHYIQYGTIWEGNDVPVRDDDLYKPIIDEITENLGKLEDGHPYPEDATPWEVRVPTSLVLVQDLEEIPGIVDILTGSAVDIRNETD